LVFIKDSFGYNLKKVDEAGIIRRIKTSATTNKAQKVVYPLTEWKI